MFFGCVRSLAGDSRPSRSSYRIPEGFSWGCPKMADFHGTVWHGLTFPSFLRLKTVSGPLWHELARPGTLWHALARSGTAKITNKTKACQAAPGRAKTPLARPLSYFNRKNEGKARARQSVPWKSVPFGTTPRKPQVDIIITASASTRHNVICTRCHHYELQGRSLFYPSFIIFI